MKHYSIEKNQSGKWVTLENSVIWVTALDHLQWWYFELVRERQPFFSVVIRDPDQRIVGSLLNQHTERTGS